MKKEKKVLVLLVGTGWWLVLGERGSGGREGAAAGTGRVNCGQKKSVVWCLPACLLLGGEKTAGFGRGRLCW